MKNLFVAAARSSAAFFLLFLFCCALSFRANAQNAQAGVTFQDVTAKAGIRFVHINGAFG